MKDIEYVMLRVVTSIGLSYLSTATLYFLFTGELLRDIWI